MVFMWLGLTWVQFAIDRQSGIHFFFILIAAVLSEEIFVVIIFSNKKNNLFSTHLSIEHKNALFHSLETVLMKEGEKIFILM